MSDLQEAFEEALKDAVPVKDWYCTLYCKWQWYGGAEEGGWWGTTVQSEAFQRFDSQKEAEAALEAVKALAIEKTQESKRMHGEMCLKQLEYCEIRGLDDANSVFGEVDGESCYFVRVEHKLGSQNYSSSPYYE